MIAARSLPATDTTRLLGLDDFIRSPNVRALRSWAETVKFVEEEPGSEGSSEQYSFLSALLSDWSYHSLAMMPVRAGRDPVSIVEWPGQVSVAAWLWYPPGNTTPLCRRCNPALNSGRYSVNRSAENSSTEIATMIRGRAIDCASEAAGTAATMTGNSTLNFICALSLHSGRTGSALPRRLHPLDELAGELVPDEWSEQGLRRRETDLPAEAARLAQGERDPRRVDELRRQRHYHHPEPQHREDALHKERLARGNTTGGVCCSHATARAAAQRRRRHRRRAPHPRSSYDRAHRAHRP